MMSVSRVRGVCLQEFNGGLSRFKGLLSIAINKEWHRKLLKVKDGVAYKRYKWAGRKTKREDSETCFKFSML